MPSVGKNWRSPGVLTELTWFLKGPFPTTPPFQFWCKEKQPETCFNNKFCIYPAVTKHECSVASSSDPFISSLPTGPVKPVNTKHLVILAACITFLKKQTGHFSSMLVLFCYDLLQLPPIKMLKYKFALQISWSCSSLCKNTQQSF